MLYRNLSDRKVAEQVFEEYLELREKYPDDPDFRQPNFGAKEFAYIVNRYDLGSEAFTLISNNWDGRGFSYDVAEPGLDRETALENVKEAIYDKDVQEAIHTGIGWDNHIEMSVFESPVWTDSVIRYRALEYQEEDIVLKFKANVERYFLDILNEKRKELKLQPLKEDVLCLQDVS